MISKTKSEKVINHIISFNIEFLFIIQAAEVDEQKNLLVNFPKNSIEKFYLYLIQIEERLNISTLEALKRAFTQNSSSDDFDIDGSGQMTLDEFTQVVKRYVGSRRGV